MNDSCDVAIVGAGPYGLAAAAHLRARNGLETRVFGEPMSFWSAMPVGMMLRSPYPACNIGDPEGVLTLDDYNRGHGLPVEKPVPLDRFVDYGRWFQEQVVPDLDRRWVENVESANGSGYRLTLAGGESVTAKNVVVAAGIDRFPWRPEVFRGLPKELVFHASEQREIAPYSGRRVVVVGGGQSALEGAALLHEAGADVEVLVRESFVRWLSFRIQHKLGPVTKLLYAPPDVGPMGVSQLVARPHLFRLLPRRAMDRLDPRSIRPAGAGWLVDRMQDVPIRTGVSVVSAVPRDGGLELGLDDGSTRRVDHVLLGTGYRVDLAKYPFLSPRLQETLRTVRGYPVLSRGFETSAKRLYVVGAPAARSFGPLMRFVAGSDFAARTVARAIRRR
jgi:lysine/ornithine N-monooxygenase